MQRVFCLLNVSSSEGLLSLFNRVIQEKFYCFLYIISRVTSEGWRHPSLDLMSAYLGSRANLCFVYHLRVTKRFAVFAVGICRRTGRAPSRKSYPKSCVLDGNGILKEKR